MRTVFYGVVEKGRLKLQQREMFEKHLLSLEGEIQLTISKLKKGRSTNQNKYYWGVVIKLIAESTGYSQDEAHNAMRMLFLRDESRGIPTLESTTALTTVEMEEYLASIRQFAAEKLDVQIPEPSEIEL